MRRANWTWLESFFWANGLQVSPGRLSIFPSWVKTSPFWSIQSEIPLGVMWEKDKGTGVWVALLDCRMDLQARSQAGYLHQIGDPPASCHACCWLLLAPPFASRRRACLLPPWKSMKRQFSEQLFPHHFREFPFGNPTWKPPFYRVRLVGNHHFMFHRTPLGNHKLGFSFACQPGHWQRFCWTATQQRGRMGEKSERSHKPKLICRQVRQVSHFRGPPG